MKKVIAFIGRAGSGKDYQCSLLQEAGYKKVAFADALRDIAFTSLGLDPQESMKYYDWYKANECIVVLNGEKTHTINFRQFLENLGTQGIRKYDSNFWVNSLLYTIENTNQNICISDMRFLNEYFHIHDYCMEHDIEFKCIFCDYHSERYQDKNTHDSAWLSNKLVELGYKDLQELHLQDFVGLTTEKMLDSIK